MTSIRQEDFTQSIADALQYISYYHPTDYIKALGEAWEREQSPAARDAMAQILVNSRMCAEGHRPICQDTGIVTVFLEIGMEVRWDTPGMGVEDMVNEGVRRAYLFPDNKLRDYCGQVKKIIVPELNMGQIVHEVARVMPPDTEIHSLQRYDGEILTPVQLLEKLEEVM